MEIVTGPVSIAEILQDRNNWRRYLAWKGDELEPWSRQVVSKMLTCRTPALGCHLFLCDDCELVRLVPHSCKTTFCSSCGAARTDAWCRELLSDLLDVVYRHLVLTLPRELRHLIRVNKDVLLNRLYRAGSRSVLSLTAAKPRPLPGINRKRMARRRRRFLPGFLIVCHTFGSDLKFNPHLHVLATAGGLAPDGSRWIDAPRRSLLPVHELAREWKKNVIAEIRQAEQQGLLRHPPFGGDPANPTNVEALLTCVAKKRWWVYIGPTLEQVDHAIRYCCRYTRRPAIGEMRILRYDGANVDFLYTDYTDAERKKVMRRSALYFIHRLVQHIPPKNFIQVRYYGLLATANRGKLLPLARRRLGQRKRRRPRPDSWHTRRRAHNIADPLACPFCGKTMRCYGMLFGCPETIAEIARVDIRERLPPDCCVPRSRVKRLSRAA
jgi:hypothetical protein